MGFIPLKDFIFQIIYLLFSDYRNNSQSCLQTASFKEFWECPTFIQCFQKVLNFLFDIIYEVFTIILLNILIFLCYSCLFLSHENIFMKFLTCIHIEFFVFFYYKLFIYISLIFTKELKSE